MLRVMLAIIVVVGGVLTGRAFAQSAMRRGRLLRDLIDGLRALRIQMTGMYEPVQSALARSECEVFRAVGEAMGRERVSAREAWRQVAEPFTRRGGRLDALTGEDVSELDYLFAGLGESGREQQERLLVATIKSFEDRLDGARAAAEEAQRLYVNLGALIGLMLALIVI